MKSESKLLKQLTSKVWALNSKTYEDQVSEALQDSSKCLSLSSEICSKSFDTLLATIFVSNLSFLFTEIENNKITMKTQLDKTKFYSDMSLLLQNRFKTRFKDMFMQGDDINENLQDLILGRKEFVAEETYTLRGSNENSRILIFDKMTIKFSKDYKQINIDANSNNNDQKFLEETGLKNLNYFIAISYNI